MDWKNLGAQLAQIGLPLLGAALPIPGGMALGTALASCLGLPANAAPDQILATISSSSEALAKAKEFEQQHQQAMLRMAIDYEVASRQADSADLAAINESLREELRNSGTEAWYQKAWRPFNGFVVGLASLVAVVFTCYLFYVAIVLKDPTALNVIPQLATAIAMILAVPGAAVGITAWTRGKAQIEDIKRAVQ
jgi:hypothetical protein